MGWSDSSQAFTWAFIQLCPAFTQINSFLRTNLPKSEIARGASSAVFAPAQSAQKPLFLLEITFPLRLSGGDGLLFVLSWKLWNHFNLSQGMGNVPA